MFKKLIRKYQVLHMLIEILEYCFVFSCLFKTGTSQIIYCEHCSLMSMYKVLKSMFIFTLCQIHPKSMSFSKKYRRQNQQGIIKYKTSLWKMMAKQETIIDEGYIISSMRKKGSHDRVIKSCFRCISCLYMYI